MLKRVTVLIGTCFLAMRATSVLACGEEEVRAATQRYLEIWSYTEDEGVDGLAELSDIFAEGPDAFVTIDNFGDQVTVTRNFDEYIGTFQPMMAENIAFQEVTTVGPIDVIAAEDFAVSTFVLRGVGETTGGETWDFRQAATFVWEKQEGRCRLVREHLTTLPDE